MSVGLLALLEYLVTGKPISDREMAEVRGEVSFSDAIAAHLEWKHRLVEALHSPQANTVDPAEVGQDTRCVLGQWIHSHGQRRYGNLSSFEELRSHHARFHEIAHGIADLSRQGRSAEASELLAGEFQQASTEIVRRLQHLSRLFGS